MSLQLGIGVIAALCGLWFVYRDYRRAPPPDLLPPPDKSCERNRVECV